MTTQLTTIRGIPATVTPRKLQFTGPCPFAGCDKQEAHEHLRFNEMGWDLASPFIWTHRDKREEQAQ